MEIAGWILVALVAYIGFAALKELSTISEEMKTIRQYLQVNGLYPHGSLPQQTLNTVEQIGDVFLKELQEIKKNQVNR